MKRRRLPIALRADRETVVTRVRDIPATTHHGALIPINFVTTVLLYRGNISAMKQVTRTQTGVRLESRLLKVLKALATELEMPLGDLLEGIVLHAFEGKAPFSSPTLKKIKALKSVYGLDLTAEDSHSLQEAQTQ
jgi:hypothetical protein